MDKKQKDAIRKISIYQYADKEREGKAYKNGKDGEKEFVIPPFSEILEMMFCGIKQLGFTEINRCNPREANCIIRVFQKLHQEYEWGLCFNMYGAECYTKEDGVWITKSGYRLQFDQHCIRQHLLQDECVTFDTNFLDCYVKIS